MTHRNPLGQQSGIELLTSALTAEHRIRNTPRAAASLIDMLKSARQKLSDDVSDLERRLAGVAAGGVALPPPPDVTPFRFPSVRARMTVGSTEDRDVGRLFKAAELFWVSKDMTSLTLAAAETVPDVELSRGLWPCDVGAMLFASPIALRPWGDPEDGAPSFSLALWAPGPTGVRVRAWPGYRETVEWMSESLRGRQISKGSAVFGEGKDRYRALAAAYVSETFTVPEFPTYDTYDLPDASPAGDTLGRVLAAAWLLMGQPMIVESRVERGAPAGKGKRRERPSVTVIDLRRIHSDSTGQRNVGSYDHRWVVRGHWRNQACGTGRADRRPVWIAPYVKGPDDAPLLVTEKVNVWRR